MSKFHEPYRLDLISNKIEVKKPSGYKIIRDVESFISIYSYKNVKDKTNDTLNSDIVRNIGSVILASNISVYNFVMDWSAFDENDVSPLDDLPNIAFIGTRMFLKDEDKQHPFLEGTQQVFRTTFGKQCILLFTSNEIFLIKPNGSYIRFFND